MEVVPQAEGKNISGITGEIPNCTEVGNVCGVGSTGFLVAENFEIEGEDIKIKPTFANDLLTMKLKVKPTPETNLFNITLNFINEQQINFDVFPDQQAEFELEVVVVTQNLLAIEVNGVNQTITVIANSNKVVLDAIITDFKIFLPLNADTQFATFGRSLEGDFINTLTQEEEEIFYNYLELYNPNSTNIGLIKEDLKVDKQKAYEIIGRINVTGFYPTDLILEKGGGFYKDLYSSSATITDFYNNLRQKVVDTVDQVIVGDGD